MLSVGGFTQDCLLSSVVPPQSLVVFHLLAPQCTLVVVVNLLHCILNLCPKILFVYYNGIFSISLKSNVVLKTKRLASWISNFELPSAWFRSWYAVWAGTVSDQLFSKIVVLSFFFYTTGLVFKNCAGRNCPPCQSWCWYEYDSKLPACSNVFLVCHEKLNRSPGLSAISTCSYPSWHSALRIPNVLLASVGRAPTRVARSLHLSMVVSTHITWDRKSLLIFLDLPQSGRLENWLGD